MKKFWYRYIVNPILNRPTRTVIWGYASYVLLSWALLCLPICWQADPISPLDNLFSATSAISTTGLVTVSTPDSYNFLGEFVLVCAFQVGGLGYMTLGSFAILVREKPLSPTRQRVGETVFALPDRFDLRVFIRHTIIFSALVEIAGFIALYIAFSAAQVPNALWAALFHTVSAFCTAGFSIFPDSLVGFRGDVWVNGIIAILSILGAIGFIVASDVWLSLTRRQGSVTLTTKIILSVTFSLIAFGWAFLFFAEPSMTQLPLHERFLASGFQAMTALTTVGFNTHPIGALAAAPVLMIVILMVIGASPSGTGGGLKTTSVSAAIGTLWAALRGQKDVTFLGRRIPTNRLLGAFAALVFYLTMFLVGSIFLLSLQSQPFEDIAFEVASALGTVGLSRGITGDLVPFGKIIIIMLMFIGRIGPITFGLALFKRAQQNVRLAEEDLVI